MSLTRAQLERELLIGRRLGLLLFRVGLDGTTMNGTNPDLNGPLRESLRRAGFAVIDPLVVAEADVAGLGGVQMEQVLEVAHLRVLWLVRDHWGRARDRAIDEAKNDTIMPNMNLPLRVVALNADYSALVGDIDRMTRRINSLYGDDLGTISGGSVSLGFVTPQCPPFFP